MQSHWVAFFGCGVLKHSSNHVLHHDVSSDADMASISASVPPMGLSYARHPQGPEFFIANVDVNHCNRHPAHALWTLPVHLSPRGVRSALPPPVAP